MSGAKLTLDDLPANTRRRLGIKRARVSQFSKDAVRTNALKVLAEMSVAEFYARRAKHYRELEAVLSGLLAKKVPADSPLSAVQLAACHGLAEMAAERCERCAREESAEGQ